MLPEEAESGHASPPSNEDDTDSKYDIISDEIDFDLLLDSIDQDSLIVEFPQNFDSSIFFDLIMKNCNVDATWHTKEKLMEKECNIYHALMVSPRLLSFFKLQW